ncbi:MAG: hypothetical protein NC399_07175 [Muribaculum sp.]|nr:hypothetical protein [Muribaculum sp.]
MEQAKQRELVEAAMETLRKYVWDLAAAAGEGEDYAADLWRRIRNSEGVLKELAYYHDYGTFWGEYKVAGYGLTDILVWQVDHFKAYLDRHEEVNRWRPERLFLHALDALLQMEVDPEPFIRKMCGETGTDYVGKFKEY